MLNIKVTHVRIDNMKLSVVASLSSFYYHFECIYIYIYIYVCVCVCKTLLDGAVEYTECISPTNDRPGFNIKPSEGRDYILSVLGNVEYSFISLALRSTLTWKGST